VNDEIRLDGDDVLIEEIEPDECDECAGGPATHAVYIDFRSAGMCSPVGRFCKTCAEEVASRIRDGLPQP